MNTFRTGFVHLAIVGLCALAGMAHAQNPAEPPAAPPAPSVEAPDPAPNVEAPSVTAPNVEAPNVDVTSRDDRRRWRNRRHDNDRVVVAGDVTLDAGQQANAVIAVLGNATSAGEVSDAVVAVVGDARVTGPAKDVVAVLGNVYLNSRVSGDVVATMGNIELGPNAEVGGDVTAVGGQLIRDPASVIHGGVQHVLSFASGSFDWFRPWARNCLILLRPLAIAPGLGWAWGLTFGLLALYVLLAVLFRPTVDRCIDLFEERPGKTIVAALLAALLTPVTFALLLITVIGIAFVPILALALLLTWLFGKVVVLAWIGRNIFRLTGQNGSRLHAAGAVVIGGIIVTLLYLVPFVGLLVYNAIGVLGLGIMVYALVLSLKQRRADNGPEVAMAGAPAGGPSSTFSEPPRYSASASAPDSKWEVYESPSEESARSGDVPGGAAASASSTEAGASGTAAAGAAGPSTTSAGAGAYGTQRPAYEFTPSGSASGATPGSSGGRAGSSGGFTGGPFDPASAGAALTYPRAGFGVRMAALFIDIILVAVLLGIVDSTREAELIALATYGAVMWKLKGTTIGGIVFGLKVVRVDGKPIDWATSTVRALSCFLSLVVAGLGFIWIAFDDGRQAWHDKIAGTAVVRVPKGVSLL